MNAKLKNLKPRELFIPPKYRKQGATRAYRSGYDHYFIDKKIFSKNRPRLGCGRFADAWEAGFLAAENWYLRRKLRPRKNYCECLVKPGGGPAYVPPDSKLLYQPEPLPDPDDWWQRMIPLSSR